MSIKTEEADRLARDLSRLTGETMTQAVTTALRERLDRERQRELEARGGTGFGPELDEFLAELRSHISPGATYTKAEADELCGDNDLMRDMGLDPDAY